MLPQIHVYLINILLMHLLNLIFITFLILHLVPMIQPIILPINMFLFLIHTFYNILLLLPIDYVFYTFTLLNAMILLQYNVILLFLIYFLSLIFQLYLNEYPSISMVCIYQLFLLHSHTMINFNTSKWLFHILELLSIIFQPLYIYRLFRISYLKLNTIILFLQVSILLQLLMLYPIYLLLHTFQMPHQVSLL